MSIEHKDIIDPNIHEPKGVSTAAAETVYRANGLGSGTWGFPLLQGQTAAEDNKVPMKSGSGILWQDHPWYAPNFAEIDRAPAEVALTANTPVILDGFAFDDYVGGKYTLTGTNELTVEDSGYYLLTVRGRFSPSTNLSSSNETITMSVRVNGTVSVPYREMDITILRNAIAGDVFTVENSRIIGLTAEDVIDIEIEADATRTYTVQAHLQLIKIAHFAGA